MGLRLQQGELGDNNRIQYFTEDFNHRKSCVLQSNSRCCQTRSKSLAVYRVTAGPYAMQHEQVQAGRGEVATQRFCTFS